MNGKEVLTMTTATAIEMQNNFGKYLGLVMSGQEIVVTQNGREVGRFVPKNATTSYLTDSLLGILKEDSDLDEVRTESMRNKYGLVDWHKCHQSATAEAVHADYIITRNIKDFSKSKVTAITPSDFLAKKTNACFLIFDYYKQQAEEIHLCLLCYLIIYLRFLIP